MTGRFDEVRERAHHRALALELRAVVTDFNGLQTASRSSPLQQPTAAIYA